MPVAGGALGCWSAWEEGSSSTDLHLSCRENSSSNTCASSGQRPVFRNPFSAVSILAVFAYALPTKPAM